MARDADPALLLELDRVSLRFGGVSALTDVSFDCRAGEVHALVGENGSGKSTLLGIASGFVEPDRQLTPLQRSNLDPGYASVGRYITEASRHLEPGGLLTLGFSLQLGRLELIEEIAAAAGLTVRIARSEEPTAERPYDLQLLHLTPPA